MGDSTNIKTTDYTDFTDKAGAWYTLDGRMQFLCLAKTSPQPSIVKELRG